MDSEKIVLNNIFRLSEISEVICKGIYKRDGIEQLEISFKNGKTIVFDSKQDVNEVWQDRFKSIIKNILQKIMNIN